MNDNSKTGAAAGSAAAVRVEADVVVIGGGGSGLAAAIEARSLGRRVVLVEKNPKLGGTTAWSVGSITATNTPHQLAKGILDSPEHHFEDLGKFNAPLGVPDNLALRRLLVENVGETFRWLMSMGIEFAGPLPEPPHRKPRMHNVLPNSRAYIHYLERRARRIGVEIRAATRAERLLVEDGRVVGVACDGPDGAVELRALGGVVLTSGDFSGNAEMRSRLISPEIAQVRPINPTNTGDGHRMALELGGRIVHPHLHLAGIRFQAPPTSWIMELPPNRLVTRFMRWALEALPGWLLRPFVMSFLTTILVPSAHLLEEGGVLINRRGERFADELGDPAAALARQPDRLAYILLDGKLAERFSRWPYYVSTAPGVAYAFVADYRRNRKDVFREGRSPAELARNLGVDPAALERTIADYNGSGAGSGGGSPRGTRPRLDRAPYVAMGPVLNYINFTDGGMAVDEQLRVLGAGDRPIPGLFAGGMVGMGGVLLEGHGHHLGWAFTSGRLAGRRAANGAVSEDLPAPTEG